MEKPKLRLAATLMCLRPSSDGQIEVLMGQGEVYNAMRSTPERAAPMRFPGELKFPGGMKDDTDIDLKRTALRELSEEFLVEDVSGVEVHPFRVKETGSGSNNTVYRVQSHCGFVDEFPKLDIDVQGLNKKLEERREIFRKSVESGQFWTLSKEEKMEVSPEVYEVQWMTLVEAINASERDGFVNAWQEQECKRLGIEREIAMNTILTMKEVLEHGDYATLKAKVKAREGVQYA